MVSKNLRLAWESIRQSRWRNFMTMLGIIIGVASVITTVSIGEGVQRQISRQVAELGTNLILVRPAYPGSNASSNVGTDYFSRAALSPLSDDDLKAINKTSGVAASAPLMTVNGVASYEDNKYKDGVVLGTTSDFASIVRQDVEFGQFLTPNDEGREFVVIGKNVAEQLFEQNVPIGRSVDFRGEDYVVKGVFEEFESDPFATGVDLNNAIFMSYTTAKAVNDGSAPIFQIFVEAAQDKERAEVAENIDSALLKTHAKQRDYVVLSQEDAVASTDNILVVVTGFVAGIAFVALLMGGIGIMNVMLVSVTERTREIGIRKAIGATSRQILAQFLAEALMLGIVGSFLGVIVAGLANLVLRIVTDLQPVITWQIVAISIAVAVVTAVLFGVTPAIKAARKDPIEALRYE